MRSPDRNGTLRSMERHKYKKSMGIFLAAALILSFAAPAGAYDYPLTESAIRDAYFLGTSQASAGGPFLPQYSHSIPDLAVGRLVSRARIETPFVHVPEQVSRNLNYSA